ncbi:hypothetical protein Tco_1332978, partial [Tanacetum coccineum]
MKELLEQQGLAAALEELPAATIVAYDNVIQKRITILLSDEDQALLLLTSLSSSYDNFMETLLYGRDSLKLEDVLATLNSRELQKMTGAKGDGGEGLYVRGIIWSERYEAGYNHKKSQGFVRNEDQYGNLPREGPKPFMVRPSMKLGQRSDLFKSNTHNLPLHLSFPSKVENVVIQDLAIPRTLRSYRGLIVPIYAQSVAPSVFNPHHISKINTNERTPVTTTVFAATTPGNMPLIYQASTSTDPTLMISLAFVETNHEILESLLRYRRRHIRNEELRTELGYRSKDYDEQREMESRPERTREVTLPLRTRSPRVRRQHERVVGFEEVSNREGSRTGRNTEGNRPSEAEAEENGRREMNLPPLLAAHLGRNENGQPLQSLLTSVHEGRQSSINIGENLLSNDDTLQILGLHEDQRISGFVHGLRTRKLVEHLSTDLPSTYKGLMEKTYTWIEAREVATNETSNDQRDNFECPREILAIKKVARSFEQPPRMLGIRLSRDMSKYFYFHEDHGHDSNDFQQLRSQIEEVVKSGQLSHLVKGIKKERAKTSDSQWGEKKEKSTTPTEVPILLINQKKACKR